MALQRFAGIGSYAPTLDVIVPPPAFTSVTLDALGDRLVLIGRFVHKDHATKTVDGVGFLFGAVVKTAGSIMQVSLQDPSLSAGPVMREDATPDQTLTIANADAGMVSDTWYEAGFTGAATRSLTPGDRIAVVFQISSLFSGDTFAIKGLSVMTNSTAAESGTIQNISGSYVSAGMLPNVVLRCTDGSYGTIERAWPLTVINTHSVNVATGTADEYAMGIQYPYPLAIDGVAASMSLITAGDTTEVLLYSGTTVLATWTLDHNAVRVAAGAHYHGPIPEKILVANTLYRLAVRPVGTNNISIYSFDVANAAHFQCHMGGDLNWHQWTRLDQGSWGGEVTTRRLFAGVRASGFDDGVGAAHGNFSGGLTE